MKSDNEAMSRIRQILVLHWDASGELCAGDAAWMDAESQTIEGMLAAGARALEVQRYLRLMELARVGRSLHAAEVRHSIALMLYSAARHVVDEGVE